MTPDEFFAVALPYAHQAHAQTGVLVSVILAQWADETGYGGPDWSPNNNPGNVGSYDGQPVAKFPSLQAGVNAYIQTMRLDYYAAVRAATTATAQATALGQSPWASGHYGNPPGADLIAILNTYNLTQYDALPPIPVPIKEETMSLATLPNGEVVISAVGAGTRTDHLLVFTLNPTNPANPQFNVIDVTTGIGTADPFTVSSA